MIWVYIFVYSCSNMNLCIFMFLILFLCFFNFVKIDKKKNLNRMLTWHTDVVFLLLFY